MINPTKTKLTSFGKSIKELGPIKKQEQEVHSMNTLTITLGFITEDNSPNTTKPTVVAIF